MKDDSHIVLVVPGDNFIALSVVRSLGRKGVKVVAMCGRDGIGRYSRSCYKSCRMPATRADLATSVMEAIVRYHISHVICTSDEAITLLNEERSTLEGLAQLLFPCQRTADLAIHKDKTLQIAASIGIDIPKTLMVRGVEELARIPLSYPVVVKPRHQDIRIERERRLNFKVRYAYSHSELLSMFGEFPVTDEYPLIQEYVEGCGVGLSVIMHEGMPIQLFQHRRIREFPPSGGVSVFCESVLLEPDLVEKSVSLLRAMNWEGVAMVEYRRDFHSKRTVLMEVNGRFWGSLPLAIHAGADFPYVLYSCWNEDSPPPAGGYQIGVRCRAVTGDTKWLVSVLKNYSERRIRAIGAYLSAFQPRTRYFAWSSDDPVPAIMNFFLRLRRLCARLGGAWMRRRKGGAGNGCGGIERAN